MHSPPSIATLMQSLPAHLISPDTCWWLEFVPPVDSTPPPHRRSAAFSWTIAPLAFSNIPPMMVQSFACSANLLISGMEQGEELLAVPGVGQGKGVTTIDACSLFSRLTGDAPPLLFLPFR